MQPDVNELGTSYLLCPPWDLECSISIDRKKDAWNIKSIIITVQKWYVYFSFLRIYN